MQLCNSPSVQAATLVGKVLMKQLKYVSMVESRDAQPGYAELTGHT